MPASKIDTEEAQLRPDLSYTLSATLKTEDNVSRVLARALEKPFS